MTACKACGIKLGRGNKTGYCKRHVSAAIACPENSAKIRAGLKRYFAVPENRERARETVRRNCMTEHARQRRSDTAKAIGLYRIGMPHALTAEAIAHRGRKISDQRMAWCPRELRDEYRHLVRSKRLPAAEARVIILAQHEQDMAKFRRDVLGVAA